MHTWLHNGERLTMPSASRPAGRQGLFCALSILTICVMGTAIIAVASKPSVAQVRTNNQPLPAPSTTSPPTTTLRGVLNKRALSATSPTASQALQTNAERQIDAWWAQFGSLKGVTPVLPMTTDYIVDLLAAQQLGKALFWDTQAGQDGIACASCHFHAGADLRTQNQVNPGIRANDVVFSARTGGGQASVAVVGKTGTTGPNAELAARDFPLRKLANPNDRGSEILFDTNDVVSSQGAFQSAFAASTHALDRALDRAVDSAGNRTRGKDNCGSDRDVYHRGEPSGAGTAVAHSRGGLQFRVTEPRHTPTTVNAVFNRRQFWDGRANAVFNGVDPYGLRTYAPDVQVQDIQAADDPGTSILAGPVAGRVAGTVGRRVGNPNAAGTGILALANGPKGKLVLEQPLINGASLASQAVAINTRGNDALAAELATTRCANSSFADLGRRLLGSQPLSTQVIHPEDSVFGDARTTGLVNTVDLPGLNTTYAALIRKAFAPRYWSAAGQYRVDGATGQITQTNSTGDDTLSYSQIEHNFSLFWGLAIQAYEQLLISDDSAFDRGPGALTAAAARGLEVFVGAGQCSGCHSGPLFTKAAVTSGQTTDRLLDSGLLGDGYPALFDEGFANTGVRPTSEDRGLGDRDPYGFDLSVSRQYKWRLLNQAGRSPDIFEAAPCSLSILVLAECQTSVRQGGGGARRASGSLAVAPVVDVTGAPRDAVDGAFKIPTLRNVGLTAPYFHNGGQATLKDVVRFYNRGGDRRGPLDQDSTGLGTPTPFGKIQPTNLAPDIGVNANTATNNALGLSEDNIDDLVQFLLSLTDDRVACHADVFDHPELPLVLGHRATPRNGSTRAKDIVTTLPAVGKRGLLNCFPNTGDLFGTANTSDPRKLQDIVTQKLR